MKLLCLTQLILEKNCNEIEVKNNKAEEKSDEKKQNEYPLKIYCQKVLIVLV